MRSTSLRPVLAAALAVLAPSLLPAAAAADPQVNGEFSVTEQPGRLALGPDGNVWVTLGGPTKDVAKVTPAGAVTEYSVSNVTAPIGITAGPDMNLWITQTGGVVRFPPAPPQTGTELTGTPFAVAAIGMANTVTTGPDGNLWTASGDQLIKISTAGVATPYPITGMGARGIAKGADGLLYVADFANGKIIRATTSDPPVTAPFDVKGGPQELAPASGSDHVVAYTNPQAEFGFIPLTGDPIVKSIPLTDPTGITLGADGANWIANFLSGDLTRLAPDGTVTNLTGFTGDAGPRHITTGLNDTLWVSLEKTRQVARVSGVSPTPQPTPTPTPGPTPEPTPDPDPDPEPGRLTLTAERTAAKVRRGTAPQVRVSLSLAATVQLRLQRQVTGRRVKGRCVAPSRAPRRAKACKRWVTLTAEVRQVAAGTSTLTLRLRPRPLGRYRLRVRASSGAQSAVRTLAFKVVRPKL